MKHIIHPKKHRSISVILLAAVVFLGLQAAAAALQKNQVGDFAQIAAYVYAFVIFWIIFSYDTYRRHIAAVPILWHELANYLILPSVIYFSTVALLFLAPFNRSLQELWIVLATLGLSIGLWYLQTVFHSHREGSRHLRQLLFATKLFASFLGFAAALGIGRHEGFGDIWTGLLVMLASHLLMRQAIFQHHDMHGHMLRFVLIVGLTLGLVGAFLYSFWNVNFYSAALLLSALYSTIWGYVHHKYIDRDLTAQIIYEYLSVLFVVLVILFATTDFSERLLR